MAHTDIRGVAEESVNPIEKLERTSLIMAASIHRRSAEELLHPEERRRLGVWSPVLFGAAALPEARAMAWPQGGKYPGWWPTKSPEAAAPEPEAEDADVVRTLLLSAALATARASDRRAYVRSPPRLRSLMVAWWRQDQMMARLAALKA